MNPKEIESSAENSHSPEESIHQFEAMKLAQNYIDHEIKKLENLKPCRYKDGWPEDKWREEIEKHPFFMTKPPDPSTELHPLLEGLQQLKYDEEDNTVDDLAETYKNDGLLSFKLGKYRDAVTNFSAGLKYDCSPSLKAQLYNNRGASHFFIQNFKSALLDSEEAVKLNPTYLKAKIRITQCLFHLEKYEQCIDRCDEILEGNPDNAKITDLRKTAFYKKKIYEREVRKQKKKMNEEEKLLNAIRNRNINVNIQGKKLTSVYQLDPLPIPPNTDPPPLPRVSLQGECLVWPAIFIFPQHYRYECVQSFNENIMFSDILEEVFQGIHNDWDSNRVYQRDTINIYFEDKYLNPVKLSLDWSLIEAQTHPQYFQDSGTVIFKILMKNSVTENTVMAERK